MKQSQRIETYMTCTPHTINSGMPLATARNMMKKYGVRHLPVQVAGHLVGVVTERDLLLGMTLDKGGTLLVDDVMAPDPYSVTKDAALGEVAEKMATNAYGSAVVHDEAGKVIGIFTAIDALRAMSDQLNAKARKAEIAKGA